MTARRRVASLATLDHIHQPDGTYQWVLVTRHPDEGGMGREDRPTTFRRAQASRREWIEAILATTAARS